MPELPEIEAYLGALRARVAGQTIRNITIKSFSLLRTYDPPIDAAIGKSVDSLSRMGKRIVFSLSDDLYLVLHLMVAGRLQWRAPGAKVPGRVGLAAFDFDEGTLTLTEQGTKRRASLHVVQGADAVAALDPGGIELESATLEAFTAALQRERHTLKRTLTDAHLFSGIGGAFADEILHRAGLSPLQMSDRLGDDAVRNLFDATRAVLDEWRTIRIEETGDDFPKKVTAFHPKMAVHGKFGEPCPVCGSPIQRIVYASRETNYCATCQTDGRMLADRSLSRLLKDDWPKTIDELEG